MAETLGEVKGNDNSVSSESCDISGERSAIAKSGPEQCEVLHIFPLRPRGIAEAGSHNLTTERTITTHLSARSNDEDDTESNLESIDDSLDTGIEHSEQSSTVGVFLESYDGALGKKLREHYSDIARKKREEIKPAAINVGRANAQITRLGGQQETVTTHTEVDRRTSTKSASAVRRTPWTTDDNVLRRHRSCGAGPGSALRRRALSELQALQSRAQALVKWRRKVRAVIFSLRCVKQHCTGFTERHEHLPYLRTVQYLDYRADRIKDLMFDPSDFCADRQMRITDETKRVLCKRRSDRTEEEVYSAQLALRSIQSFAEFPARMQRKLAERGQFEAFEARRIITREGDPPVAFYFILSGTVLAMTVDSETNTCTAVGEYVKGDCFEEDPMLNGSPRACTVMTKEACEFITVSAKEYRLIFVQDGVKSLNDPDQEYFLKNYQQKCRIPIAQCSKCSSQSGLREIRHGVLWLPDTVQQKRSLNFLEGWPVQILRDKPSKCLFKYFTRGSILAKDTRRYNWIIIVKSGSISVLKKLKKVGPYEWKKSAPLKALSEKERRERKEEKRLWRRIILPELRLPLRRHRDVDEVEERIDGKPKPFTHPDIKVHMDYPQPQPGHKEKVGKYYYPNLWTYKNEAEENNKDEGGIFPNINRQYLYLISSEHDDTGSPGPRSDDRMPGWSRVTQHRESGGIRVPGGPLSPTYSESSRRSSVFSPTDLFSSTRSSTTTFEERINRIMEEVEHGLPDPYEELSEVDLNPQFVKVQTLVKGDAWGLADALLEDQASFTVVSDGADCLLLDRKLYLQFAPDSLQRRMKQQLCPYPGDAALQSGLQASVDWGQYRRTVLDTTMHHVRGTRVRRDAVFETKAQESS